MLEHTQSAHVVDCEEGFVGMCAHTPLGQATTAAIQAVRRKGELCFQIRNAEMS